jgi:hypothetical protein
MAAGRPVSFEIVGRTLEAAASQTLGGRIATGLLVVTGLALLGWVAFFVRRNLKLGRGDRRGATRLALMSLCLLAVFGVLRSNHGLGFLEAESFVLFLGLSVLLSVLFWGLYIADART